MSTVLNNKIPVLDGQSTALPIPQTSFQTVVFPMAMITAFNGAAGFYTEAGIYNNGNQNSPLRDINEYSIVLPAYRTILTIGTNGFSSVSNPSYAVGVLSVGQIASDTSYDGSIYDIFAKDKTWNTKYTN